MTGRCRKIAIALYDYAIFRRVAWLVSLLDSWTVPLAQKLRIIAVKVLSPDVCRVHVTRKLIPRVRNCCIQSHDLAIPASC